MNSLDATVTSVGTPVWCEEYQTWRVEIEYNCWGHVSTTEMWYKDRDKAFALKVGDTIIV